MKQGSARTAAGRPTVETSEAKALLFMHRRGRSVGLHSTSNGQSADGRTSRAGNGEGRATNRENRRTKTTVHPSDRPLHRTADHQCLGPEPPTTTRPRRPGRQAANAAGQCRPAATACMQPPVCKLPLPPVLTRPLDRPCAAAADDVSPARRPAMAALAEPTPLGSVRHVRRPPISDKSEREIHLKPHKRPGKNRTCLAG